MLGLMGTLCLHFEELPLFFKVGRTILHPFRQCTKVQNFFTSSPTFVISCLIDDNNHSNRCEMVSCGFDLHFFLFKNGFFCTLNPCAECGLTSNIRSNHPCNFGGRLLSTQVSIILIYKTNGLENWS